MTSLFLKQSQDAAQLTRNLLTKGREFPYLVSSLPACDAPGLNSKSDDIDPLYPLAASARGAPSSLVGLRTSPTRRGCSQSLSHE